MLVWGSLDLYKKKFLCVLRSNIKLNSKMCREVIFRVILCHLIMFSILINFSLYFTIFVLSCNIIIMHLFLFTERSFKKWYERQLHSDKWQLEILSNIALSLFACAQDQRQFIHTFKYVKSKKKKKKKKRILIH